MENTNNNHNNTSSSSSSNNTDTNVNPTTTTTTTTATTATTTTTTTTTPNISSPTLCTAGCGFFGSEAFNNMCSQCYKAKNKDKPSATTTTTTKKEETNISASIEKSRKHLRSPSPDDLRASSAPSSSIASSPAADAPTPNSDKPAQLNKGRCFKCRLKVPLAKQAANKCRCGYIFCDSHRYPDRHDCDIDFAKMDREILAKNNPKLHERPRGGRSFQRIDSL